MKKYNGFTLAECVTAITIVILLSAIAVSICLMANNLTIKNNCLKFALNECDNICAIFEKSDVGLSGEKIANLKSDLISYYGENLTFYENDDLCNFEIRFDAKKLVYSKDSSSLIYSKIYIYNSKYITLSVCVKNGDNVLYENLNLFQKEFVNV
jgi:hypothetical protein